MRSPYASGVFRPGRHSRNAHRLAAARQIRPQFHRVKLLLLLLGVCRVGYYSYSLLDTFVVQRYENWAFDQLIAGRSGVTLTGYLREKLFGSAPALPAPRLADSPTTPATQLHRLAEGDLVGRVSIERLGISAIVREGVSDGTLRTAVGHVPSTSLPGAAGNFAIAAHRDTLFRALKDIRDGDRVTVQSAAQTFTYQVVRTEIVTPLDVKVLRPDGDGLAEDIAHGSTAPRLLTMITCYPFYYVGSAPKRFIVQARLLRENPTS